MAFDKLLIRDFLEFSKDRLDIEEPIISILENYIRNYSEGKFRKTILVMKKGIENGKSFSDVLYAAKFINKIEKVVLDNAGKDIAKAIVNILDATEMGEGATGAYWNSGITLFMMGFIFFIIGVFPGPIINMIVGMSPNATPEMLPFYLQDPMVLVMAGGIPILLMFGVIGYYKMMKPTNPFYIYKVSKLDELEDGAMLMSLLKSLVDAGYTLQNAFGQLGDVTTNQLHKRMFKNIYKSYSSGASRIVPNFKHSGFTTVVYERLDLIEKGGDVDVNLEKAIITIRKARDRQVKKLQGALPPFMSFMAYLIMGTFSIHLVAKQMDAMFGL